MLRRLMMKRQARASAAPLNPVRNTRARILPLVLAALIAVVYFIGAKLAWVLTPQAGIPLLWPPGAVLFAALLLTPIGFWKVLLVPLFIAHLAAQAGSGAALATAVLEFCGVLTALMIGAIALRYALGGAPAFDRLRETGLFLLCSILTAALAALPLAGSAWAQRAGGDWLALWRLFFHAQALALLVLTPLFVTGAQALRIWFERSFAITARADRALECGALCALAACVLVYGAMADLRPALPMLACAWLGLVVWAALRFSPLMASVLLVAASSVAAWGVALENDFFRDESLSGAAPVLQWFLSGLAATALLCAALARERGRASQQAQDQEKLLGLALHAAPMSSWAWDLGSQTIAMKTAASDLFQGRLFVQCLERIHEEDRREVELALAGAVERGEPYEVEFRLRNPDGVLRCIRSRGAPQLDASGRPARVLGITVDISERRRREQQIREQRQELAHLGRVAMLGELSGAITHELNQPLTTVLSNAQAAQQLLDCEQPDLVEIRAILADIVAENKRAGEIIKRLRTLLKKGEISPQELDVNALVLEVIGLEHSDLIARNVFVTTQLSESLPLVRADRVQIQQVLLNLMMNAGDAMVDNPAGERLIRIGTCCENGFVQILVSDSGPGLPPREPERIFEAFFTTKEQGLGLGLTICRSIVSAHGGELHARDTGQGAVFTIALPSVEVVEVVS